MSMKSLDEMRNELQICKTCNARPTQMTKVSLNGPKHQLPRDKFGKEINVGCTVHLDHNNKNRVVISLEYVGSDVWIVGCDAGGAFLMPESTFNVTVVGR